ncbi:ABC transporter permease [Enterocloster bolteae]|uniref:ABC transporter permease n=1 Tax=Enterocloster bolteae TaxID=208479 RepID=UPI002A82D9F1|nr:ABC transporter permease [Enterocloster bolteae]
MKEKILGMVKSTAGAVLIVTILMTVIVQLLTGHFYTAYNLSTFSRSASFTIIIGFAQTLVLLLGGIDLSVASVAGLCSMIFAMLTTVGGVNPFLSIAIALMAGVALGAINGIFICSLNLTPFIVTLATSALYKGIIYVATKGIPLTGIPESVTIIGQGTLFGIIPYPAIIMVVLAVILIYMLRYTSFGRHIYAVGGNEHAAKIVGIQINKTKMAVYALTGFISALAGILMVLRLGSSQVNIGENWAMPSITAGVLGGTSMNGGSGGIGGTIVGGLLMSVISFSISLLGISSYWDQIVTGVVVLIAVAIDSIRRRNNSNV